MTAEPTVEPLRFTVEQFEQMGLAGILDPEVGYELLDGVITVMSPVGPPHAGVVSRIAELMILRLAGRVTVHVQNPVKLGRRSEPQPDVVVARRRRDFYASAHPAAEDIHLAIEVADSTLRTDRLVKLPMYARQGVAEVWIVNIVDAVVEVSTRPAGEGYAELRSFRGAEQFSPGAFPDLVLTAADLLGDG